MPFWKSKKNSATSTPSVNWATADIQPDLRWMNHATNPTAPDWLGLAQDVIAKSRRDPDTVDTLKVMLMVSRVVIGQTKAFMATVGDTSGPADLDSLCAREDFQFQMLWDFLSLRGANGVAMIDRLSDLLTSEYLTDPIADLVREGHADRTS